jgi:hypothetical protein
MRAIVMSLGWVQVHGLRSSHLALEHRRTRSRPKGLEGGPPSPGAGRRCPPPPCRLPEMPPSPLPFVAAPRRRPKGLLAGRSEVGRAGIEPATLGLKRRSAVSARCGAAEKSAANRRFLADMDAI